MKTVFLIVTPAKPAKPFEASGRAPTVFHCPPLNTSVVSVPVLELREAFNKKKPFSY